MVIVIPFKIPEDVYDQNGRRVERKGDVVVSHGLDTATGRTVILPCEPYRVFVAQHCYRVPEGWALKTD